MDNATGGVPERERVVKFGTGGRAQFVCGLRWYTLQKTEDRKVSFLNQAKKNAPSGGSYRSVCLFETGDSDTSYAVGYAKGNYSRSIALAALLVSDKQKGERGVEIFHLTDVNGERFSWLFLHREGVVDYDGDFTGTEDEVRRHLEQIKQDERLQGSTSTLNVTDNDYAQSVEIIENAISRLLKENKSRCRIIPLERDYAPIVKWALFAALSAAVGVYGYEYYEKQHAERMARELYEQRTAEARAKIEIIRRNAYPPVWKDAPAVEEILPVIITAIRNIQPRIRGWEWQGAKWSGGKNLIIEYKKSPTLPWSSPPGSFDPAKPFQSTVSMPLDIVQATPRKELGIMSFKDGVEYISTVTLSKPYRHKIKWEPVQKSKKTEGNITVTVEAAYQTGKLEIQGMNYIPDDIIKILNVPGMVIESMQRKSTGAWELRGTLYVHKKH